LSSGKITIVYLVREKNTPHLYVLKVITKFWRHVSTVLNEQAALTRLSGSDFILPLRACFHDTDYWYLLTVRVEVFQSDAAISLMVEIGVYPWR
jgi:hypothetical protein